MRSKHAKFGEKTTCSMTRPPTLPCIAPFPSPSVFPISPSDMYITGMVNKTA